MALASATELNERYTLQRTLDDTSTFSITYLGLDTERGGEVVITEYFPRHLAERVAESQAEGQAVRPTGDEHLFQQGLKYFRKEAKMLRALDQANLAREIEDFEANGTAYRVTAHQAGASLATALEKNDGSISERAALTVMKPVLSALHALHREGLLHGGLSPQAIYLSKSRKVLLRGFRSAHLQLARKTDTLEDAVISGISPAEQYTASGRQGPWTDVYAAAATLYRAVAGRTLPEAREPLAKETIAKHLDGAEGLSDGVKRVLKLALAPGPRDRMSAQAFRELLEDPSKLAGEEGRDAAPPKAPRKETAQESDGGLEVWGPASIAAAAAEAAKKDKEKSRARRKAEAEKASAAAARDDRPAAPGRTAEDDDSKSDDALPVSNRLAMGGGATLLVVLLAGAGLLFTGVLGGGETSAEGSAGARYASLVAEGDSLYEMADYGAAAERYERAQAQHPEAASASGRVTERLLMIDRLRDAIGRENYRRAMSRGDSLVARAQRSASASERGALSERARMFYEQANEAYFAALGSRPDDSLALRRVQSVSSALEAGAAGAEEANAETSVEEERQRLFERYRNEGDEALASEDYETARRKFREALDYQPGSEYVAEKLEEISSRISASQRQAQYRRYRRRADSLFAAGDLADARREYQLALDVKPGDNAANGRIYTIDRRLAEQQRNQQQYQYHRGRGDVLFDEGQLEEAAQSYNKALEYRPQDGYVKDRLAEVQQKVAEAEEAAQSAAEAEARRTESGIYKVPDEEAKIVGGLSALYGKISYPERARRLGTEGRVYLRVTVGADGSVRNVEMLRGIGHGADAEAERAVRNTAFEPATVDGQPVAAYKTVMVQFRIDGNSP